MSPTLISNRCITPSSRIKKLLSTTTIQTQTKEYPRTIAKPSWSPHNHGMTRFILIVVLSLLFQSRAMFMQVETTPVPVDRVLTNLTRRLVTDTNNFELLHVIARLHSLSYSRAASNWIVSVETNSARAKPGFSHSSDPGMPFLGYGPGLPPASVLHATNSAKATAAKQHLEQAVQFYPTRHQNRNKQRDSLHRIGLVFDSGRANKRSQGSVTSRCRSRVARRKKVGSPHVSNYARGDRLPLPASRSATGQKGTRSTESNQI